ncbi:hypothetical protein GCM10017714_03930 [Curtobacterium pusillum]|nr:hypothetical protein [Curtobacterium pusillum]GLK31115.1 hypothetical protein GCM10017610_14000 [Curtobacterium pusillum]
MRLQHRIALVLAAVVVATGFAAVGPATTANAAAPTTGRYTPLDTTRVWSGSVGTTAKVITIAGHAGVPSTATAVVVNVEVEKPTAAGYVRVTPRGVDARVATQEFSARQTISNLATVRLAQGGIQVKLSAGSGTVYLDVSGYYANGSGATYTPLDAARVFQQKVGTSAVRVPLAGRGGIPTNATAVAVNTEVGTPTADGYVRVTPAGKDAVVAAQVFTRGTTISNLVIVKLSGGAAQVKVSRGTATVFMDVAGYYANTTTGSVFVPMDTVRAYAGPVSTTARTVRVAGTAGVPGTATAIVANAETEQTTAAGYLRLTPAGQDAQVATQVFGARQAVSNLVMTKVVGSPTDRRVQVKVSRGSAVLDLDVAGYFVDGSSGSGFGADVSWPQGGSTSGYPTGQAFGVVGVNHGLATTTNPYFAQQLAWAQASAGGTSQPKVQLYVNTANPGQAFKDDPTLSRASWPTSNVDPGGSSAPNPYAACTTGTAALTSTGCSWMYGWNRAYEDAQERGVSNPASYRWWLDAETDGSWQKTTTLNRATLEGMTAYFTGIGAQVGVYSSPSEWTTLFGTVPSTSTLYKLPTWRAIGSATAAQAQAACSAAPYVAGGRTTMVQFVSGGFDRDVSCV